VVARPTMRHLAAFLSGALLLLALALVLLATRGPAAAAEHGSSYARSLEDDATAQLSTIRLARLAATFRGGPITTSTGEVVDVRVSDALPVETATPEGWAEFLVHLTHGSELGMLRASIVTFDEVQEICGARALGCYGRDQLVAPGETVVDTSPEEVVRHEYGHHIAAHRLNDPWIAIDWGPKRWATAANVCSRVTRNEAYPGDEGANYRLNPGEAWAEVYRLMDERKAGITTATWPIVARSFFPDADDLVAAEQDVLQPWAASRARLYTKTFAKKATRVWWIPVTTPLDGSVRVSATVPTAGGSVDVALVGADRKTVVRRAKWIGQRVKRLDGSICGQRSLFVRVTEKGLVGRVRVSVTTA
jgi:hypothetical protein